MHESLNSITSHFALVRVNRNPVDVQRIGRLRRNFEERHVARIEFIELTVILLILGIVSVVTCALLAQRLRQEAGREVLIDRLLHWPPRLLSVNEELRLLKECC